MAERARISKNHFGNIENGETNPGFVSLLGIAEAFGMTVGELVARYEQLDR